MAVAAPQDVAKKMLVMLRSATEDSSFPRLALVLHGRREERVRCRAEECVGVDLMLPGVHGHPPAQHLHRIGHWAIGAQAVGQRDARSRLWGYRGGLRAEHLQELMLDSRKKCDIEKVEHVLHAAMQVGVPFATHLDRKNAAPQEDRADRVAT